MAGCLRGYFPALIGLKPGMRVVVAGGTGTVGSGAVLALLRQGAKVVVATRSLEKFYCVHEKTPEDLQFNLAVVECDVSTERGVKNLFQEATCQKGGVQHVLSSLGGWWQKGQLTDQSVCEYKKTLDDQALGHFLMMKTFLPYLNVREGSTYTMVTGNAHQVYAGKDTSLMSVGSGTVNGMALAVREEYASECVNVNQFHVKCSVLPCDDSSLPPDPFNVGKDLIGAAISASIAGQLRGKTTIATRQDAKCLMVSN